MHPELLYIIAKHQAEQLSRQAAYSQPTYAIRKDERASVLRSGAGLVSLCQLARKSLNRIVTGLRA